MLPILLAATLLSSNTAVTPMFKWPVGDVRLYRYDINGTSEVKHVLPATLLEALAPTVVSYAWNLSGELTERVLVAHPDSGTSTIELSIRISSLTVNGRRFEGPSSPLVVKEEVRQQGVLHRPLAVAVVTSNGLTLASNTEDTLPLDAVRIPLLPEFHWGLDGFWHWQQTKAAAPLAADGRTTSLRLQIPRPVWVDRPIADIAKTESWPSSEHEVPGPFATTVPTTVPPFGVVQEEYGNCGNGINGARMIEADVSIQFDSERGCFEQLNGFYEVRHDIDGQASRIDRVTVRLNRIH